MSQWRNARLKFRADKLAGAKSTSGNHRDADWTAGTKSVQSLRMAASGNHLKVTHSTLQNYCCPIPLVSYLVTVGFPLRSPIITAYFLYYILSSRPEESQVNLLKFHIIPTTAMASTNSGITTDAVTGERYIPSSVRADGTKRREIRVRPGYRPPEDVELYKNRAAQAWKNRGNSGVPGAESLKTENESPAKTSTAASNKNAKRREAKKKAKAAQEGTATTEGKNVNEIDNWRTPASGADKKQSSGSDKAAGGAEDTVDPEAENEKKARNLKKKLRQARDLRDKKNQGEALLPEQLEKVIKIQELIRQLDALGFDSNGDKKDGSAEKEDKV
ncbi:hypothetical protein BDV38DRAFT_177336 [Aspergillus pseudotamarii]|uniref:WIBG Mago-binding domain-containing protein n=1 Tax=Aspergillus pseudotamarii TaxID=132259 RepID=A0A5N6T6N7_ASPPS|nr:uncharacterized protein BDV38DRAFT_177336 [Aspergillus pseudotamarii]KAE8142014.1 hypothetical protein BDV38DRAFT_177336 [Aspergillus pseudotamarii]